MKTTIQPAKVIYTAKTKTTGGRGDGIAKSSDGRLDIRLSAPGSRGPGTNPEQLLAVGWSACFEDAMGIAAYKKLITLPEGTSIDAEIDLCSVKSEFFLRARFSVNVPGLNKELAKQLMDEARRTCPYTKALAGKMEVEFKLA